MAKNRKRPGRTRTKRDNRREPMLLSKIDPQEINVREGEVKSLVCPDCRTWRRLMGDTKLVIREHCHSDKVAPGEKHERCPGSNQVVQLDITVEEWSEAMLAADSTATGRRSARQHYKPLPAPAKPVTRMSPMSMSVAGALAAYREHLKKCRASSKDGRCGGTHRCVDGARLAGVYAELERAQSVRDREARVDSLLARYRSSMVWAKRSEATASAKSTAKRSGTAVEEANNTCRHRLPGTVSDYRGPQVPTQPVRIP
ncbi:hypothetical protein [Streptomyces europaeiscabiei]|uniref:hypothetical protein n=1 Tax=Streptomyces europaeiscabiei TaxID=146819 RepID=UPI0029BF306F|nr:hypothetical protein [Streptomyces europaeiscabiei]MDX3587555.1 hypothetical protein [Streptomyces europaeiscabiei]